MKFIPLILLFALPGMSLAADNPIFKVEPGLYEVQHNILLGGQPLFEQSLEYCVTPEESSRSLSSLLSDLDDIGDCTLDNTVIKANQGHTDLVCDVKNLGLKISGRLTAVYEPEHVQYIYNGKLADTFFPVRVIGSGKAHRIGACPPPDRATDRP